MSRPTTFRLGVDLLGSDASPSQVLEGMCQAASSLEGAVQLVAVGAFPEGEIYPFPLLEAGEAIHMDEAPLRALRLKPHSSLVRGIQSLGQGELDAFVSAGNTGALIAASSLYLPKQPTISRPGLMAEVPTLKGSMAVIDVGGNVQCTPAHLVQFTRLAVGFQRRVNAIDLPKVGLLNIGQEVQKGNHLARRTYQALAALSEREGSFVFVGNVEGRRAYQGVVDVLVTDGFTGNIFLKASEGVSHFLLEECRRLEGEEGAFFGALLQRVRPPRFPGAVVMGVKSLVVKCHGESTSQTIAETILGTAIISEAMSSLREEPF